MSLSLKPSRPITKISSNLASSTTEVEEGPEQPNTTSNSNM